MRRKRTMTAAVVLAAAAVAMSAAAGASAQSPTETATVPAGAVGTLTVAATAVDTNDGVPAGEVKDLDACIELFDGEMLGDLPQELIDELNAEGAELAAALDAAGISYEMVTDETGVTYPEWDWDDDDANDIADEFFDDLKGEFVGDIDDMFFDKDLPQELIDELNAEGAELAAALDAAGISYEMVTDETGVTYPEWDWDDDDANDIADEFFDDLKGEFVGDIDDMFFDKDLPQELIDELNAEGAELAAAFDAAGITYEMVTDDAGVTYPEWDWNDDEANDIAKEFFDDLKGEFVGDIDDMFLDKDLPQELIDELNAEGAELAAAFDAAGITYEMVTDDAGVTYPEWDWNDDEANDIADEFFGDEYGEFDKELFECIDELPQEIVDDLNAEGAELAAALDAAGIPYEMVTDEMGVTFPVWDWEDEAANRVADEFFGSYDFDVLDDIGSAGVIGGNAGFGVLEGAQSLVTVLDR